MFASRLQIARGSMMSLHQVAPHLERVNNPAAGRRSKRHLHVFKSRTGSCRSTRSLHFSKVVDERLSSERVSHPGARGRAVFVSSGAGVVENSDILTDIPTENEILGISRGISEEIPRKHKIWFPRNFLGINRRNSEETSIRRNIPRKFRGNMFSSEKTDEFRGNIRAVGEPFEDFT
ncbi:hypothetical protein F2Q69_00020611 [Brassica cretica]|uniref:Uncharacterized protein n=1 Tax=Brassica cretica TaxID=69181 RepID=A0A8S9QGI5_BRACR|nr:hypothetical protein F2Q69_00020611 [Brassica cretica]